MQLLLDALDCLDYLEREQGKRRATHAHKPEDYFSGFNDAVTALRKAVSSDSALTVEQILSESVE
jgi:hypothetical protein